MRHKRPKTPSHTLALTKKPENQQLPHSTLIINHLATSGSFHNRKKPEEIGSFPAIPEVAPEAIGASLRFHHGKTRLVQHCPSLKLQLPTYSPEQGPAVEFAKQVSRRFSCLAGNITKISHNALACDTNVIFFGANRLISNNTHLKFFFPHRVIF